MEIQIQKTSLEDFFYTENLTREAFWNMYSPGCNEHLILHQLRKSSCYIPDLDFVAICENKIIAHVISTKARVIDKRNFDHEVLCVGPVSVLPAYQNKGIGTNLLQHSIAEAAEMRYNAMILFGAPEYYHRFGFVNAKVFGITTKDDQNFDPFMVLEIEENGLKNVKGKFFEDQAYSVKDEDLIEFEKKFPTKEKGKPVFDISNYSI